MGHWVILIPEEDTCRTSSFGTGDVRARSSTQHQLLAAVGRAAKMQKKLHGAISNQAKTLADFSQSVELVRGTRGPKLQIHKSRSGSMQLGVVGDNAKCGARGRALSANEILNMAFDKRKNRHALADRYKVWG